MFLQQVHICFQLRLLNEESDAETEGEERQNEGEKEHVLDAGGGGMSVPKHQHVLLRKKTSDSFKNAEREADQILFHLSEARAKELWPAEKDFLKLGNFSIAD